ncbi:Proteasome activator complex subunit 4 [Termitomyces sp. J132]|nr:Proteasome activator complex subunit 4 [Termitomyces sp. J132]
MDIPDMSMLNINEVQVPDDIAKFKAYASSLPYAIEPCNKMIELLDFIILRIVQCVEAKDYDVGLYQWDSMLTYWWMLKYPIPKDRRVQLAKLYFLVSTIPGMPINVVATCADAFCKLTKSKKKITIEDMRLPWKPIYEILQSDLFLKRRQFEYTQLSWCMGYIASHARRFFSPSATEEMLQTFVPQLDGTQLNSILAPQYYLLTFLPLTHPQLYLPMLFRIWESVNSYMYDDRMLHFLSELAEMHVDPSISDPHKVARLPDDERVEGESRPKWSEAETKVSENWPGLYKDVGIFSENEWQFFMCKCLASMEIPLADAGSLTTGPNADSQASFEIGRLPNPNWRITSLARIIVYSMAPDGQPVPPSNAPTPLFSPFPSGVNTPQLRDNSLKEFLAAPLGKKDQGKAYLAGSKALDSLARLIASTESFFHPSNSGTWTNDLTAFIKYIVYDFNKRWHEEQRPDCKTPLLTASSFDKDNEARTGKIIADRNALGYVLAGFCDNLVLHPILQRAVPSLEALVETQRTIAVIKALGAVAPAIISRNVYYPGAKHLVPILQLLIPGIDLNDPNKTLCTAAFLVEIAQFIKFGDLTVNDEPRPTFLDAEPTLPVDNSVPLPSFSLDDMDDQYTDIEQRLTIEEEDALLKDSTGNLPDWVASLVRRVIQLFENLPDEGPDGSTGGITEIQLVDAVTVLNMIFDYASSNVRPNAVRAIHQLVECVANADPIKTHTKFFSFCAGKIRHELENGASSLRTTSLSSPLPSDATLHWNLAILRGTIYNDGKSLLRYKEELLSLLKLLHNKTYSKRGYSWSGKLLSSVLLTLTHTYPLENKFVNPDEWNGTDFHTKHHQHWGKLYAPENVKVDVNFLKAAHRISHAGQLSWHTPNEEEIQFAVDIFKILIEPALAILEHLIEDDTLRDETWRNDFCRHLSFVRNAFSGIPTLLQQKITPEEAASAIVTTDILNELPEMIASISPIASGFCLTDIEDHRYQYISSLRNRFGMFLHKASMSLQHQGEENTVDAVDMLIRAVRTYLLEYGDSRDNYTVNEEQYRNEKNVARNFAHQKVWPRAIYVRRARYYHSARLHWNSIERRRGAIENALIDDVVEWSLWHYAIIRRSSQSLLDSICEFYDGVRRRALPVLFKALDPGTDDDRMKGALWTLNLPSIGKYAISEPSLSPSVIEGLLGCQHNEKPSIQECVSVVAENGLGSFLEPNHLVYDIPTPRVDKAIAQLRATLCLSDDPEERDLVFRLRKQRMERSQLFENAAQRNILSVLDVGESESTHWRYEIVATRALRTLVRRDAPTSPRHLQYFLDRVYDDHPTIRYYAQRAVTKIARNIKLRTFCITPMDLALMRVRNPLKMKMVIEPSHKLTAKVLADYRTPFDLNQDIRKPRFLDRNPPGWVAWDDSVALYLPPSPTKSAFSAWDPTSKDTIETLRNSAIDPEFWEEVSERYAEETQETTLTQDNASFVKSIFQLLQDEPFEALRPTLEKLLQNKDQNKQRAAAEFVAGLISGSKHWSTTKQEKIWNWFKPFLKQLFLNIKADTLMIWTTFFEYIFYHTDPRRVQPLVEFIITEFKNIDYNAEMTFDGIKVLSLFRAFYEELGRKFDAWTEDTLARTWVEINSEHDDLRAYIGEILAFTQKIKASASNISPKPSLPTPEVFVKECQVVPKDFDIMGMRGVFHKERVDELVHRFGVWRNERLPGVRAYQSTYDKVGILVCKWFYRTLHDVNAISTFDYILPLLPELLRFTELHDNTELSNRASTLLVRMCGVTPPLVMVGQILDGIFEAIRTSPSWRIRLKALPLVQVFYFRQVPLIPEIKIVEILEMLCSCLDDEVVEVREMAATTLSGILRLSPRRSVLTLKDRFVRLAKSSHIPPRHDPGYNKAIRHRHAAILGICALVDSYPYTVEKWMPGLLTNVLAEHTYDPIPISTTVRKCASNFKRTHQDTWHEDSKRFDDDQLAALSTLLTGSSYCE